MPDDSNVAPRREPPQRVSTQQAFIHTLSPSWMVALREQAPSGAHASLETHHGDVRSTELRDAQRAWALCLTAEHLVMGLEVLDDRRLLTRAVCAVLRFALSRLPVEPSPPLLQVLEVAEAWSHHRPVSDADIAAAIAQANEPPEGGPPGPRALMALSLRSLADVIDPDESVPGLAAVGAVDVAASAWFDAGISDDYDEARLAFANEVRRVIDPWETFTAATGEVELHSAPSDDRDIPF